MKHTVIITGFNCEKYVDQCIRSVIHQTKKAHEILIYNDASKDGTAGVLKKYEHLSFIKVFHSNKNRGALHARFSMVHKATGEVVSFLGLDDALVPDALETVSKHYTDNVKMTYGNWYGMKFKESPRVEKYPDEVFENKSFRRSTWRATALNTFRTELIKSVPKSVLIDENGNFFDNCTDLAYSFPCLEMCKSNEVVAIQKPIYIYRRQHDNTTLQRLGSNHKKNIRQKLKNIKPIC